MEGGYLKKKIQEFMLAEMVYDSKDEQSEILKKDEKTEMIYCITNFAWEN